MNQSAFMPSPASQTERNGRSFKILYVSVHEILEFDDLRMFTDSGHHVFSLGAFQDAEGGGGGGRFRPVLPQFYDAPHAEDLRVFRETNQSNIKITREFAERFDVIIVNHDIGWIINNLNEISSVKVIYRTIGQSSTELEQAVKDFSGNFTIVRYSKKECDLPHFAKTDAVIYFSKTASDFPLWNGGSRIVTFTNSYPHRSDIIPSVEAYNQIAATGPYDLYGFDNDGVPAWRGGLSPAEQLDVYQNCGLSFYVKAILPSYTLSFMEALFVGVPILAPSAAYLNDPILSDRYEVPEILDFNADLLYDSLQDARKKAEWLLENPEYCHALTERSRAKAHEMFGAANVSRQWNALLESII